MLKKVKQRISAGKIVSVLLAAILICGMIPTMSVTARAAGGEVYYPVDFSDAMLRSGVGQKISRDCMFVSVVTMEAYMVGATSEEDKNTVYNAVKNANPGSTSKKPNAEVIQSTNWGKTIGYETMTYSLENLYREISRGNPVMIYRAGTSTKSPHWSVVCGYTGSASRLEESGFQMVNVSHAGVNKTNLKSWRNGRSITCCRRRTFGVAVTAFQGIRFCVDHPPIVQKKGETFGAFGSVVSGRAMTDVTVSVTEAYTGHSIFTKSVDPKGKSCNIGKNFDSSVTMSKWDEGDYYYTITAEDSAGNCETYRQFFTIRSSFPATVPEEPDNTGAVIGIGGTLFEEAEAAQESEPETSIFDIGDAVVDAAEAAVEEAEAAQESEPETSIFDIGDAVVDAAEAAVEEAEAQPPVSAEIFLDNAILPDGDLARGSAFTVGGVISSKLTLTNVTFTVSDEDGSVVFQGEAAPNDSVYSLYDMDSQLTFSKLACGSYTWRITAVSETSCTCWDGCFSVRESDVTGSGCTCPQGTLAKGKTFSCKGTVSSGSAIANVTMSVYSVDGVMQFEASAAPGTNSYDLHDLDAQMTFRLLDAGRYVYRVTVTDAGGVARNVITTSFSVQ